MSGLESQKPIDIAKLKVDNVKKYEGNKNGKIDTYAEVESLSIFLADNRESLTDKQVDYLEKTISKAEKEIIKNTDKETAKLLGDLGKRITELSDENGIVTKAGAQELSAMLNKGVLTEFQESYVRKLILKSGFKLEDDRVDRLTFNGIKESFLDELLEKAEYDPDRFLELLYNSKQLSHLQLLEIKVWTKEHCLVPERDRNHKIVMIEKDGEKVPKMRISKEIFDEVFFKPIPDESNSEVPIESEPVDIEEEELKETE